MGPLAQILISGLLIGVVYALVASGLNLVFGVFHVLNIAHGEFLFVGAYISYYLWVAGLHPLLTLPVTAVAMYAVGALLQLSLVERIVNRSIVISLIVMFGISVAVRGLGLYLFGVNDRSVTHYRGALDIGGVLIANSRLAVVAVALPLLVAMHLYLKHAKYGIAIKATAQNADIAESCGIDVRRVRMRTMAISAALAGVAGALLMFMFPMNPQSGFNFAIVAFVVAVIGGLGNFYGSIVGGLALGAIEGVATFYTNAQISIAIAFLLLVLTLVVRPTGILGARA